MIRTRCREEYEVRTIRFIDQEASDTDFRFRAVSRVEYLFPAMSISEKEREREREKERNFLHKREVSRVECKRKTVSTKNAYREKLEKRRNRNRELLSRNSRSRDHTGTRGIDFVKVVTQRAKITHI